MDEKDMVVMLACVHERGRAAVVGDNGNRETNVSLVRWVGCLT